MEPSCRAGCSVSSQWLDEVVAVYQNMSDAERNLILEKLMNASSFDQLYYLQDNLSKIRHRDFMIFLPREITEYILSFLDLTGLCRCCQVSKHWKSLISNSAKIWEIQCIKLGLRMPVRSQRAIHDERETPRDLCIRMAKTLQRVKQCQAFETVTYYGHTKRVTAVYHWRDKLATGSANGELVIWDTNTDRRVYETAISNFCVTCICFDAEVLVAGSAAGDLWTLDVTTLQPIKRSGGIPGAVFALDCSPSLNLLISGSADSLVRIWSLHGGHLVDMLHGHRHWVVRIVLQKYGTVDRLEQFCEAGGILATVDKDSILVWRIMMEDGSYLRSVQVTAIQLNGIFTPGIYFDGWQLCYVEQGSFSTTLAKLCKYDVRNCVLKTEVKIPSRVKVLLGVGKKYLCFLTHCEDVGLAILDLESLKEIVSWPLPLSRPITPGHPHIGFDFKDWLDGFDGVNNTGLIIALGREDGTVLTVRWRK